MDEGELVGDAAGAVKAAEAVLTARAQFVPLPPLRERADDIPILAARFLRQAYANNDRRGKSLSEGALKLLCRYEFPGNVRELRNLVEILVILTAGDAITRATSRTPRPTSPPSAATSTRR